MSSEYGPKMNGALRAVRQMHTDTSQLLGDFDRSMLKRGWSSVLGNVATSSMSTTVSAEFWMAEGVYRYYQNAEEPESRLVEGILAAFMENRLQEPLLILARLHYPQATPLEVHGWDTWYLYFNPKGPLIQGTPIERINVLLEGRTIGRAKLLAVPLYSIKTIADVEGHMDSLRSKDLSAGGHG